MTTTPLRLQPSPVDGVPRLNHATLAQQVCDVLRSRILANEYEPGFNLREEAIAVELHVSRVPVREALRQLGADGLVDLVPRHGAIVSSLSLAEFLDAYRVRESLEVLALRLAIPRLDDLDVNHLRDLEFGMEQAAACGDVEVFFALNTDFHRFFVESSGNGYLQGIYRQLLEQMRRYQSPSLTLRGGLERSLAQHREVIDAVAARDVDGAVASMSDHIRIPQRLLEEMLEGGQETLPLRPVANAPSGTGAQRKASRRRAAEGKQSA